MLTLCAVYIVTVTSPTVTSSDAEPAELSSITVEAAKTGVPGAEIVGPVTIIDAQRIAAEQAQSIDDLIRYEPGIDVADQGSRFGLGGFSIRGISGNRVLMEQDGVPLAGSFSIGSFSNAGRDVVDVAALKQVEIIRGPASSLFGSDALGGVVSFVTRNPYDYLGGDGHHVQVNTGYHGTNNATVASATSALVSGEWSAMAHVTVRNGAELDNGLADPLDSRDQNVLIKAGYGLPGEGGLELTLDRFRARDETQVNSLETRQDFTAAFGFPYVIDTANVVANDRRQRQRVSLSQSYDTGALGTDYLRWRLYFQESGTDQDTTEARSSNIAGREASVVRQRQFRFDQRLIGTEFNASSVLTFNQHQHRLDYGFEIERGETSQIRSGVETNTQTGESSFRVGPDVFPVRDFPVSTSTRLGVYLQDQFTFGNVTIAPGLRYDRYDIDPENDRVFAADNPGITPVGLRDGQLSLKLGTVWQATRKLALRAHYVEGFRAPPVNDVNVGFTNFQFGYTAIPNPDLKSESSRSYEIGVNYVGDSISLVAAVFHTDFRDFIESFDVVGQDPVSGLLTFQSVNKSSVRIRGAEFSARWQPAALPDTLTLRTAVAYAHGNDRDLNRPVNSVAPLNGVVGVDFKSSNQRFGWSLLARAAASPNRLDDSNGPILEPAGYVVGDLLAHYAPTPNTTLRLAIYNLTDHAHTRYLDVQNVPATANAIRFQRPGRQISVSFNWSL